MSFYEVILKALALGLLSSLHCIGMCGPLVMSIPHGVNVKINALIENLGRVTTYGLMGLIMGMIGENLDLNRYQQKVTISMGVLILFMVLLPKKWKNSLSKAIGWNRYLAGMARLWKPLMQKHTFFSFYALGMIHGTLPCGLVYIALAGSLATGSSSYGVLFMVFFGLGTIPSLILTTLFGRGVLQKFKINPNKVLKFGLICMAILFILRGASLGIPYLSPNLDKGEENCCSME